MHGGASTGPRTPEGLERCRLANWKHGEYSASVLKERRMFRTFFREMRDDLCQIKRGIP
jgi:hypothetical protein